MKCSVVVVAYNEEKNIADCIKSLLNQSKKAEEILVIDDGSKDKTAEIASKFPVKVFKNKNMERSRARNFGWKKAKHPIILFAEADSVFHKDWIKNILKQFEKGADAVIDRRAVFKPKTYFQECWNAYFTIRYSKYKPFSAWAFKREVLEKTNGFDPKLNVAEDSDLGTRVIKNGFKIFLAKDAIQYHKGEPKTIFELAKRAYTFNKKKAKGFYKKHPEKFPKLRVLLFPLFFILLLTTIFFGIFFRVLLILYLGMFLKVGFQENGFKIDKTRYLLGIALNKIVGTFFSMLGLIRGKLT